jgi:hypothetical protein
MRRTSKKLLAAGSVLLAAATSQAFAVNIGGVEIPLGLTFTAGQFYTDVPTGVGQTLSGYGKVDSLNSQPVGDLCGGDCELTYRFTDYVVTSQTTTGLTFSGGTIEVFLGTGATKDFSTNNPGSSSADDLAEATNGELWLTLVGHPIDGAGNTFRAIGQDIGSTTPTGFSTGLLSVDTTRSAPANAFFNSNGIPADNGGPADFQFGASFTALNPTYPGECPGGAGCLRGSADFTTVAIPEPETYALMLSALGLIGYVVRRRRRV